MLSFLNAKQLMAQANRKREILQRGSISWLYRPFWKLTSEEVEIREKLIGQFIKSQKYDKAVCITRYFFCVSFFFFFLFLISLKRLITDSP